MKQELKFLILVLVILEVIANNYATYQSGSGVGLFIQQTPDHILANSRQVGRTVDILVEYEQIFTTIPKVAIAQSLIDLEMGSPNGFQTDVLDVTTSGFVIRITALTEKHINSVMYNWFATDDDRIHVEYVDTNDLSLLNVPLLQWVHRGAPIASSFLIGLNYDQGSIVSVNQQVVNSLEDSVDIEFKSSGDATIHLVQLCLVFSLSPNSFQTGQLGLRVTDDHAWMSRRGMIQSEVKFEFDIPMDIEENKRQYIAGISGFEAQISNSNLRVDIHDVLQRGEQALITSGTWGDSKLRELGFEAFFFSSVQQQQFDTKCAELFSECDYQGDRYRLCNSVDDLSETGFDGPVKSIHLPVGAYMTLYQELGHQGSRITIFESQDCMDTYQSSEFRNLYSDGVTEEETQSEEDRQEIEEDDGIRYSEGSSSEDAFLGEGEEFYEFSEGESLQYNTESSESFDQYSDYSSDHSSDDDDNIDEQSQNYSYYYEYYEYDEYSDNYDDEVSSDSEI